MRENAQLDLRIVGTEQLPALLGQKGLADSLRKFSANRDVLQIGVAAAEPTCRRDRLVEVGMDPSGFCFHQLGQRIHIGAL